MTQDQFFVPLDDYSKIHSEEEYFPCEWPPHWRERGQYQVESPMNASTICLDIDLAEKNMNHLTFFDPSIQPASY